MAQSNTENVCKPLSEREKFLSQQVINICFSIHKSLGPGLLESVYAKCFYYELEKRSIPYIRQGIVPIIYDGELVIEDGLRLDILADNLIIIELKAKRTIILYGKLNY